jgi:hypothetical protein
MHVCALCKLACNLLNKARWEYVIFKLKCLKGRRMIDRIIVLLCRKSVDITKNNEEISD